MKGSVKKSVSAREISRGKPPGPRCPKMAGTLHAVSLPLICGFGTSAVSGVLVVWRGFNGLSLSRRFRPFHHLHTIALRIVLNFIHDVVDKQHAPTGGLKEVSRITGVRNVLNVETFPSSSTVKLASFGVNSAVMRTSFAGSFYYRADCIYEGSSRAMKRLDLSA